ncbi:hypothetical protein [Patiriisocius marinus]|uniref:hypothetical protein n=1 Tax=Patiriisocius marinus TaxID=1397112 RepID=UPI00232E1D5F|nr:hypothetical protein [Patiriisocius marinus]
MKKYVLYTLIALGAISCNGQKADQLAQNKNDNTLIKKAEQPEGTWKVAKEFDEHGNLVKYDSIYSWSSSTNMDALNPQDRDSLMEQLKARFYTNFSMFEDQGFKPIFSQDSLFNNRFFNDDFFDSNFGEDFMNLDKMRQQMLERQKQFLEKYQSQFTKPEEEQQPPVKDTTLQEF